MILVHGTMDSSPKVSGLIIKKVVMPADCLIISKMLFCLLFVKLHDEGKSALPSLDKAIRYDDAKMHCYECCVLSVNTSNDTSNTPLMGSPNIYS